jgi:endonuclease/exonuclease/phosphatase family metal-dependent hydrolase
MKNIDTIYHIDYTFVSRSNAVDAVTVGSHADWLANSDHSPMTVDLRV